MLAYNIQYLFHNLVRKHGKYAYNRNVISMEEKNRIFAAYETNFYSPNIFMRIGLGLATLVATIALRALIIMFLKSTPFIPYFLLGESILYFYLLELVIKKFHHYKSGIDDILLYSALFTLYLSVASSPLHNLKDIQLLLSFIMTIAGLCAVIRYGDRIAAIQTILSAIFFVCAVWYKAGIIAMYTMPLLVILLSAICYWASRNFSNLPGLLHYRKCLQIVELMSLILIYTGGNFYVIDQWWTAQLKTSLTASPFMYLYAGTTALIPLYFIFKGVRNRDHLCIRLSVLMLAASLYTLHIYSLIITDEWALVLYGTFLIIVAYILIRKLKKGIEGFTYISFEDNSNWVELEELFVGGSFSKKG